MGRFFGNTPLQNPFPPPDPKSEAGLSTPKLEENFPHSSTKGLLHRCNSPFCSTFLFQIFSQRALV